MIPEQKHKQLARFFSQVLPSTGDLVAATISSQATHYKLTQVGFLSYVSVQYGVTDKNFFFSPAAFAEHSISTYSGRTQVNAISAKSLWLDIDFKDQSEGSTTTSVKEQLIKTSSVLGLDRPWLVHTGGGLHAYWPFDQELPAAEWITLARQFKACVTHASLIVQDRARTADIASLLRIPELVSAKRQGRVGFIAEGTPANVETIKNALTAYSAAHQLSLAPSRQLRVKPISVNAGLDGGLTGGGFVGPKGCSTHLKENCKIIKWAWQNPSLTHDQWYPGLVALYSLEDGAEAIHEYSTGHASYSLEAVNSKIKSFTHYTTSCDVMRDKTGQSALCEGCAFKDKGTLYHAAQLIRQVVPTEEKIIAPIDVTFEPIVVKPLPIHMPKGYKYDPIKDITNIVKEDGTAEFVCKGWLKMERVERVYGEKENFNLFFSRGFAESKGSVPAKYSVPPGALFKTTAGEDVRNALGIGNKHVMDYMKAWASRLDDDITLWRPTKMGWHYVPVGADEHEVRRFVLGDVCFEEDGRAVAVALDTALKTTIGNNIDQRGDPVKWTAAYNAAYSHPLLAEHAFATLGAFGAPLMVMTGIPALVLVLHGQSGAGKTMIQKTSASVYGRGEMIRGDKDTANFALKYVASMNSMPSWTDDVNNKTADELSSLVMTIANGRDRGRLDKTGATRVSQDEWRTIHTISTNIDVVGALSAGQDREAEIRRVVQLDLKKLPSFSTSAGVALGSTLAHNYGYIGVAYIQYIAKNYDSIQRRIVAQIKEFDSMGVEASYRYAVAGLSAMLVGGQIAVNLGFIGVDMLLMEDIAKKLLRRSALNVEASWVSSREMLGYFLASEHSKFHIVKDRLADGRTLTGGTSQYYGTVGMVDLKDKVLHLTSRALTNFLVTQGAKRTAVSFISDLVSELPDGVINNGKLRRIDILEGTAVPAVTAVYSFKLEALGDVEHLFTKGESNDGPKQSDMGATESPLHDGVTANPTKRAPPPRRQPVLSGPTEPIVKRAPPPRKTPSGPIPSGG